MFGNFGDIMKKAQEMQKRMGETQEKLAQIDVEGTSGGGMVKIVMNCKGSAKSIKIDPSLINPDDAEVLEDLVVAAINDAKRQADEKTEEEMGKVTGGMGLPGNIKLPF